jgi:glutaredoxin 3
MSKIVIYTTNICPYCVRAKNLLKSKNLSYDEIDVTNDPAARESLIKKANGRRTVPQIFIDDKHIGGCDDLIELDNSGQLNKLVNK